MQYHVRRRWAHPIISIVAAILVLILGPIIWLAFRDSAGYGDGIRIIIPPFFLFMYLALALALNYRVATVRPASVHVSVLPIPMLSSIRVDRNDILHVYARMVINYDKENLKTETYYSAGVETKQGRQVDITGPQPNLKMAKIHTEAIAQILNAGQHRHTIPVLEAAAKTDDPKIKTRVLIWGGAFVFLILLGAAWEISVNTTNIRYSGPRFW